MGTWFAGKARRHQLVKTVIAELLSRTENTHVATHGGHIDLSYVLRLVVKDLAAGGRTRSPSERARLGPTSAGEAKVKSISVADPAAGAGALDVACVRADTSLKAGVRVAVRRNKRAAAIAICNEMNKIV